MIIGIISSKDSLALICGAVFSFARKVFALTIHNTVEFVKDYDKIKLLVESFYCLRWGYHHGHGRLFGGCTTLAADRD